MKADAGGEEDVSGIKDFSAKNGYIGAPKQEKDAMRRIWGAAVLVALLIGLAAAALWWQTSRMQQMLREQVLHEAERRSVHLAAAMAGQIEALVSSLDLALQELVQTRLEKPAEVFAETSREIMAALPKGVVQYVTVVNRDGQVVLNSLGSGEVGVYVGDREHFQAQRAGGNRLHISRPVKARITGEWVFIVSRPVLRDGQFDGTVHLVVPSAFVAEKLGGLALSPSDVVSLFHRDGSFLASNRDMDRLMGSKVPPDRPFLREGAPASGSYKAPGLRDGRVRSYGWKTLNGTGLVMAIGLDEEALLAPLRPLLARSSMIESALLVMLLTGGVLIVLLIWRVGKAQAKLAQLNDQLERRVADRTAELEALNAELESFAYSVSHDLRTPLRSIHGFASILEAEEAERLSGEGRSHLQRIQSASRRMGLLITDLLSMAHLNRQVMQREPLDLSEMARAVADELDRSDPARKVRWEIEPGLTTVADPVLMQSLLQNLLGNAWKYTGRTPDARVSLRRTETDGEMQTFCVRDNGAGFDMAYASQLFQPFKRLHRHDEFEGTGVGLATVKRIVQRHGGQVRCEGKVGEGAAFWFSLPVVPEPA